MTRNPGWVCGDGSTGFCCGMWMVGWGVWGDSTQASLQRECKLLTLSINSGAQLYKGSNDQNTEQLLYNNGDDDDDDCKGDNINSSKPVVQRHTNSDDQNTKFGQRDPFVGFNLLTNLGLTLIKKKT